MSADDLSLSMVSNSANRCNTEVKMMSRRDTVPTAVDQSHNRAVDTVGRAQHAV
jgi:hypothetical protein